jgi:uncharacterized protein
VPKHLLIGSTEAYSGKSAVVMGITHQLQQQGVKIAYGKPLGTCWEEGQPPQQDADVTFMAQQLQLPPERVIQPAIFLDEATLLRYISGDMMLDYAQKLQQTVASQTCDLVLLEGPANLEEGHLVNLSLGQLAEILDARVLLVTRFKTLLAVGRMLSAHQRLGDRLMGVIINDIPTQRFDEVRNIVQPFLEAKGIPVLGLLPRNDLLRSVSVGELVHQLKAEVLCRPDRLDLMVESLSIGAMNVNSALKYFRRGRNMAVVTGGDRTDIQIAALETSTQCLILTGQMPPTPQVLSRAEDLEIPILSVDLDTLTTVEIVDRAFGQVRLHEPIKVQCVQHLVREHVNCDRLLASLGLTPAMQA